MVKRFAFGLVGVFVLVLFVTAVAKNLFDIGSAYNPPKISAFSGTTTSGSVVFYLTDNGLAGGNAMYNTVTSVCPIINDANTNYTYGWVISPDKKTLTVTAKASTGINVALVGLTLLGAPANVSNGTTVYCMVAGL